MCAGRPQARLGERHHILQLVRVGHVICALRQATDPGSRLRAASTAAAAARWTLLLFVRLLYVQLGTQNQSRGEVNTSKYIPAPRRCRDNTRDAPHALNRTCIASHGKGSKCWPRNRHRANQKRPHMRDTRRGRSTDKRQRDTPAVRSQGVMTWEQEAKQRQDGAEARRGVAVDLPRRQPDGKYRQGGLSSSNGEVDSIGHTLL